ncbi:hypothetical protein D3C84_717350 [compost metagenome]
MLAPTHRIAAAAELQGQLQALGMLVQHAQVELHQVPADDRIGVMGGEPLVEPLQQLPAAVAVLEGEVARHVHAVRRPEHIHLALAAAFEGDGIQLALGVGFDVQGRQAQARAIGRRGLQLRLEQHAAGVRRAAEAHRRGDETLHQVAFRRADIGLEHLDPGLAQQLVDIHQLAMLAAIQAEHRPMVEIAQAQRAQLDVTLAAQQRLGQRTLLGRNKGHRRLAGQTQMPRPGVGRQPELDLGAGGGIAPMSGQDEALL